jgi:signal transduction histidine kinase
MSASNVIQLPARQEDEPQLEYDALFELAAADDLGSGLRRVVEWIRRASGARRVEWWTTDDDGTLELVVEDGIAGGRRHNVPLGPAGVFVLHGGRLDPQVEWWVKSLAPIVRRRTAEERLERAAIELAVRNQALEDYAALVAHELKTPLQAALVADNPARPVEDALNLVDGLLEAAQIEAGERTFTSVWESLDQAIEDLGLEIEITTDLATTLPLRPAPLRVILRNLLSNAVAAGAQHVHVTAVRSLDSWRLLVDDDGVGLEEVDRYAAGSGLGLSLCRRIAARFGGTLELAPRPRPSGGTRATLEFVEAPR